MKHKYNGKENGNVGTCASEKRLDKFYPKGSGSKNKKYRKTHRRVINSIEFNILQKEWKKKKKVKSKCP